MPARFLADALPGALETHRLEGEDAHHLLHVLRVRAGEPVEGLDGCGGRWRAVVSETGRHHVILQGEALDNEPRPSVQLGIALALLKPSAMEWAVQKAVELGADVLIPVCTVHSVARVKGERAEKWQLRTTRIVDAALKQCGRSWRPELLPVQSWKPFLAQPTAGRRWLADLSPDTPPLATRLQGGGEDTTLLIGPEGDFTPEERAEALEAGWEPVSLGEAVLRSETAVLYGLSAMVYTMR